MAITHVNTKGKTYYLHQGVAKTGKPTYHFAVKSEGTLADSIPEGFEIYENPNAQVFLRRIPPKIITDEERQFVEDGMRKYAGIQDYKIDVRGKAIIVYTADQDVDTLADLFKDFHPDPRSNLEFMTTLRGVVQYSPMMVAAHPGDLRAAKAAGFHTACVPRPGERGEGYNPDLSSQPDFDVNAVNFDDLARQFVG
jgi:hypothetical protein